jgi:hypothetical protein
MLSQKYGNAVIGIKFMHVTFRGSSNFHGQVTGFVRDGRDDRLYLKRKTNSKTSKKFGAKTGNFHDQNFSIISFLDVPYT